MENLKNIVARDQPRIFPLRRLRLGVWESSLHKQDQIFLLVPGKPERKFVFFAVHQARELSSATHDRMKFIENLSELTLDWQKNKKRLLKLFGNRNPFSQQTNNRTDFFGVVAFELLIDDIAGFDCTNSLIRDFSRMVFEAKNVKKLTFETLTDMFGHYKLPLRQ
jgi:hypothetical protein